MLAGDFLLAISVATIAILALVFHSTTSPDGSYSNSFWKFTTNTPCKFFCHHNNRGASSSGSTSSGIHVNREWGYHLEDEGVKDVFKEEELLGLTHACWGFENLADHDDSLEFHGDKFGPYNYCEAPFPSVSDFKPPAQNAKLLQVHVFHRHGDRAPNRPLRYENATWDACHDPHETLSFHNRKESTSSSSGAAAEHKFIRVIDIPSDPPMWSGNCNLGQLTARGHDQMRRLGASIRDVYINNAEWITRNSALGAHDASKSSEAPGANEIHVRSTDVWRTMQAVQSLLSGLYPPSVQNQNHQMIPLHVRPRPIDPLSLHERVVRGTSCGKLFTKTAAVAHEELDRLTG
ncbi:hypothetical protein HDU76_007744, partial [Blyttiomyces sp. JEL0837]